MLSIYCDEFQHDWDKYLSFLAFAYNSSIHTTTKVSLYKAMFGREPRFSLEISMGTATYTGPGLEASSLASDIETHFKQIINLVKENTGQSQHKMMLQADKKTRVEYRVGEKVGYPHLNYQPKLQPKKAQLQDDTFNLELEKSIDNTTVKEDEELPLEEIIVLDITEHRIKKEKLEYLTTYSDGTTSWQPEENFILEDSIITQTVKEYYQQLKTTLLALYAQIAKIQGLIKSLKTPLSTATQQLTNLLGKKSIYLKNENQKEKFHQEIKKLTTTQAAKEYVEQLMDN
jgi:hypothetical protein